MTWDTRWRCTVSWSLVALPVAAPLRAQNATVPAAIDRSGPSTLIEAGGEMLVIDCGRGATQRLWQLRIPLSRKA